MSWCGGGLMSPTPGVDFRVCAIHGYTLCPGSWPPSPGLAPCAILICRSSALTRYSLVTPNRPDATCLTAERRLSPFSSGGKRSGASPPSPGLRPPPRRVLAVARPAGPVMGVGRRLILLRGVGAVGDGPGAEPLDDPLDRLDLVDRHRW